jgi:hypothetical protein
MTKPSSKIRVFLSSRSTSRLTIGKDTLLLSQLRKAVKKHLDALEFCGEKLLLTITNQSGYGSDGAANRAAYDNCLREVSDSHIVVVLFTGEAGWSFGSELGICHAEYLEATSKLHDFTVVFNLTRFFTGDLTEADRAFGDEAARFEMQFPEAANGEELTNRIIEQIKSFVVLRLVQAMNESKQQRLARPAYRPSADWSQHTYRQRNEAMLNGLERLVVMRPEFKRVYMNFHAVPDSLSVADARAYLGRPFLREIDDFTALAKLKAGPIHFIAVYGRVTATQVKNLVGFPDVAVNAGPFGYYLWEKTSHIQMVFLAECISDAAIDFAVTRFVEWLTTTGELPPLLLRAGKRFKILQVMHDNVE